MFKLIRLLIRLAVLLVILYFVARAGLDWAIEKNTGTQVRIGGLRVSLSPPEIQATRVRIRNLKHFREPYLAVIPEILIQVEPLDFLKGKTHITNLRINIQEMTVEKNGANEVNLNELRKNLEAKQRAQAESGRGTAHAAVSSSGYSRAGSRNLIVDRAEFSLGKLIYADSARDPVFRKEYPLNISHQVLENVTDPLSVTQQLISAVLKYAGTSILNAQVGEAANQLGAQAGEILGKAKEKLSGFFQS